MRAFDATGISLHGEQLTSGHERGACDGHLFYVIVKDYVTSLTSNLELKDAHVSRHCPNCRSRISFATFLLPRYWDSLKCPTCTTDLKLRGPFSWGVEVAALLISVGVYRAVNGSLTELVVMLPICVLLMFLQYRYARIEAEETKSSV
ncbi:hypothetical protein D2V04_03785 [Pelagerythrobacter aerophilus]|uniref:Uncharacterized protein n=1 Tax=Pelagerythrobacter aerophilus TaxID=2306995 RepID=A0A418NKL2_9SPHN|nr:hypothetical protein D2V04_03785 [Pelagerythrobacter aerophilus]